MIRIIHAKTLDVYFPIKGKINVDFIILSIHLIASTLSDLNILDHSAWTSSTA